MKSGSGHRSNGPSVPFSIRAEETIKDIFGLSKEMSKQELWAERLNKMYERDGVPPVWAENIATRQWIDVGKAALADTVVAVMDKHERKVTLTGDDSLREDWRNFATASMLGHWFLQHQGCEFEFKPNGHLFSLGEGKLSVEEVENLEANIFAGHLIMPDRYLQKYASLEPDELASTLRVPTQVLIEWQAYRAAHAQAPQR